ncbi:zinc-dependent alcohol dehydrogenase [Polycladidibacter stylochi]|uniref:zinc-dependent alcohol dehydrogenase n=1 Tax=Polycladidibacter stylochi TaxID=1807766 RepID=UPI0008328926|nr:zinc-binding alcohol dehydrogenase [Pseudovibrio stylochi]
MKKLAHSLWYKAPYTIDIFKENLSKPSSNHVLLKGLFSGISRGSEALVYRGGVPEQEYKHMRAPMQQGEFSFPVKYGYCFVGEAVEDFQYGDKGQRFFSLAPHQDFQYISQDMLIPIPHDIPSIRACLAANMETALNAIWDSSASLAQSITIVGGGTVGCLVAYLLAQLPATKVHLVDINPKRKTLAETMGGIFCLPAMAPEEQDVVFHCSASHQGLQTAINCAGFESEVVELSWFGDQTLQLNLGGSFHRKRLRLLSSQVGQVSQRQRARLTHAQRLSKSLELLNNPILDCLLAPPIDFFKAPKLLPPILEGKTDTLCQTINYS